MNSQTALNIFDSALSVMCAAARAHAQADELTKEWTGFISFDELLNAKGSYRPSISRGTPEQRTLGALYDAAQQARGDERRAFMYGTPKQAGSIIDRKNWDSTECYYRQGSRVAWWDRYTRQWIVYSVCDKGYQQGSAEFYRNKTDLLRMEECHD